MEIAWFFLLPAAAGAYFTSIGCRRAHVKRQPPRWRYAWLATLGAVLLTVVIVCREDLLHPSRSDGGKMSIWASVVMLSIVTGISAMLASAIVLEIFWRKFKRQRINSQ